jgi:hypothetical protein
VETPERTAIRIGGDLSASPDTPLREKHTLMVQNVVNLALEGVAKSGSTLRNN